MRLADTFLLKLRGAAPWHMLGVYQFGIMVCPQVLTVQHCDLTSKSLPKQTDESIYETL